MMALAFQVLWLALVIQAGESLSLVTVSVTGIIVVMFLRAFGESPSADFAFVLAATACGTIIDTTLTVLGIIEPARSVMPAPLAPLWLIALWALFATFLRIVLTYLRGRRLAQLLVGVIGGPMAYWSGMRLGAIGLHENRILAVAALALVWGAACVSLFSLSERLGTRQECLA